MERTLATRHTEEQKKRKMEDEVGSEILRKEDKAAKQAQIKNAMKQAIDGDNAPMLERYVRWGSISTSYDPQDATKWHCGKLLFRAAKWRRNKVLAKLLELGVGIDDVDSQGFTALAQAARHGNADGCRALLDHGANSDAMYARRNVPLILAAGGGYLEVCRMLLDHGADVDAFDHGGMSPLRAAVANDRAKICELLLQHGADVNEARPSETFWTVLHMAVSNGHATICRMLLNARADVNKCDGWGNTVLYYAVAGGDATICRMLILAGAMIDRTTSFANSTADGSLIATPFETALKMNNRHKGDYDAICRMLAISGAKVTPEYADLRAPMPWHPAVNRKYPVRFCRAIKTLLLCTVREESLIYGLDKYVLFIIATFLHPLDFE